MEKITEDYVSFEIAKLLKEKGFESDDCHTAYDENGQFFWHGDYSKDRKGVVDAPTLQMAMKWLRELHNIEIVIDVCKYGEDKKTMYAWTPVVIKEDLLEYPVSQTDGSVFGGICETYSEAVENGIVYCLENLI